MQPLLTSLTVRPRQRPLATHGEVEGEVEGEQQGGVYRGARADARVCAVRDAARADKGKIMM
jgi:hypothetical protein